MEQPDVVASIVYHYTDAERQQFLAQNQDPPVTWGSQRAAMSAMDNHRQAMQQELRRTLRREDASKAIEWIRHIARGYAGPRGTWGQQRSEADFPAYSVPGLVPPSGIPPPSSAHAPQLQQTGQVHPSAYQQPSSTHAPQYQPTGQVQPFGYQQSGQVHAPPHPSQVQGYTGGHQQPTPVTATASQSTYPPSTQSTQQQGRVHPRQESEGSSAESSGRQRGTHKSDSSHKKHRKN